MVNREPHRLARLELTLDIVLITGSNIPTLISTELNLIAAKLIQVVRYKGINFNIIIRYSTEFITEAFKLFRY